MIQRVFYAAGGPGDIISAHSSWKSAVPHPTEVSLTFSGQVEQFCLDIGARAYLVSRHARVERIQDGCFTLEHRPRPNPGASGLVFHGEELRYGWGLLRTAREFGADVAILDTGSTHYFLMEMFHRAGLPVVVVLHNTLWPEGHRPRGPVQRAIQALNGRFFRRIPVAIIGVSPTCVRQVAQLVGGKARPLLEVRAQFRREHFESIPPPPPWEERPFRILFVGRVVRSKGVFDILDIARKVEAAAPGQVRFEVCGMGADLEDLGREQVRQGLEGMVQLRGWASPVDQIAIYARSHACIVPTRSEFPEGFAMTAAEAVLSGRPVLSCPVVPALEVLRPACLEARTDDPASYAEQVLRLLRDRALYERLRYACAGLEGPFYDRSLGLTEVLKRAFAAQLHRGPQPPDAPRDMDCSGN